MQLIDYLKSQSFDYINFLKLGIKSYVSIKYLNILQNCNLNIGIYFGSLDPFHEGHLTVADNALKLLNIDYQKTCI